MLLLPILISVSTPHISAPHIATQAAVRIATTPHTTTPSRSIPTKPAPKPVVSQKEEPAPQYTRPMPPRGWYFINIDLGVFRMVDQANCELIRNIRGGQCLFTSMVRE